VLRDDLSVSLQLAGVPALLSRPSHDRASCCCMQRECPVPRNK
jgi:hypothetical protein